MVFSKRFWKNTCDLADTVRKTERRDKGGIYVKEWGGHTCSY